MTATFVNHTNFRFFESCPAKRVIAILSVTLTIDICKTFLRKCDCNKILVIKEIGLDSSKDSVNLEWIGESADPD